MAFDHAETAVEKFDVKVRHELSIGTCGSEVVVK
jgi:hypothetical protein